MPDDGNPTIGNDCKHLSPMTGDGAQFPQGCPCQKPAIGPNDPQQISPKIHDGRLQ